MKDYQEVVRDRYEDAGNCPHPYENQYYFLNPIGYRAATVLGGIVRRVFNAIRLEGRDVTELKILDIGCGKGFLTRLFIEATLSAEHIHGIDLASGRIAQSRRLNPALQYECADILEINSRTDCFDLITAFDVFMHFRTEEQMAIALRNVSSLLPVGGYFAWYDVVARDHFSAPSSADASGFSRRQMEEFCGRAGFRKLREFRAFKNVLGRYHSLYLRGRLPEWCVRGIELLFPGGPGNVCMLFRREQ
jgi:SAM-dependent methyltransferase